MSSSRGSSWPRDQTRVSYISCIGRRVLLPLVPPRKPLHWREGQQIFQSGSCLILAPDPCCRNPTDRCGEAGSKSPHPTEPKISYWENEGNTWAVRMDINHSNKLQGLKEVSGKRSRSVCRCVYGGDAPRSWWVAAPRDQFHSAELHQWLLLTEHLLGARHCCKHSASTNSVSYNSSVK